MSLRPFTRRDIDSIFGGWPFEHRRGMEDPFWPVTPLAIRVPMLYENPALGRFLDEEFRDMQNLERQMLDVQTRADGNSVTFGCNVVGYAPEELKVYVEGDQLVIEGEHKEHGGQSIHHKFTRHEGDQLVIEGEHKEEHGGHSIHRKFTCRIKLPEGVARDSIQCSLDDKGEHTVQTDYHQAEKPPSPQIPIGYKQSDEEQPKVDDKKVGEEDTTHTKK